MIVQYEYPRFIGDNVKLRDLFDAMVEVTVADEDDSELLDAAWLLAYNALIGFSSIELQKLSRLWSPTPLTEGGWGSGNFDHLGGDGKGPGGSQARGGTGLSKEVRLSRHAFERMGERKKYASVKAGLKSLKDKEVPDGDWHMGVKRGGKLDAVLIGTDGVVKTVLGPWAKNLKGDDLGED